MAVSGTVSAETMSKFIAMIKERPQLWQKSHEDFINREIRAKLFGELSQGTGLSEEMCRKKLKNLKDKMRTVISSLPKTEDGLPDFHKTGKIVRWAFYKNLLFMKDEFIKEAAPQPAEDPGVEGTLVYSDMGAVQESGDMVKVERAVYSDESEDDQGTYTPRPKRPKSTSSFKPKRTHCEDAETVLKKARRMENDPEYLEESQRPSQFLRDDSPPRRPTYRMDEEFLAQMLASFQAALTEGAKAKDEWQTFCDAICSDLRKLKDPLITMRAKCKIHQAVNEAVVEQLEREASTSGSRGSREDHVTKGIVNSNS